MNRTTFSLFTLVLGCGIALLYLGAMAHFDDREALVSRLVRTEQAKESAQLQALIARESSAAFQQRVALTLPQGKALQRDYHARQIASLATDKTLAQLDPDRAAHLYETARAAFQQKTYAKSNQIFRRIVEDFPDSLTIVESYFLLVEGLFQAHQYEACAEYAERMMTLYPESDMTAYALLRLGAVYQQRDRLEDAAEIYSLVLKSYRNPQVLEQAHGLLYEIQL